MLTWLAQGASLGFTAGSSPGPLQTFLIQTTLAQGWRRALVCILSPLISDIPFVILTVFIINQFPPEVIRIVQIVGGFFMFYLAWGTVKWLRAGGAFGGDAADADTAPFSAWRLLRQTILINWTSPGPYIFWGTVNGPLLAQALRVSLLHGVGFMLGFYGVFLTLLAIWIIAFDRLRHIDPRVTRALIWATVGILVLFGLQLIARGAGLIV
ncbi:MAG: LysE family transporter [Chloroflexota bacterium]|nr:LysE family transporter [Chloroflexota bacterium]